MLLGNEGLKIEAVVIAFLSKTGAIISDDKVIMKIKSKNGIDIHSGALVSRRSAFKRRNV